MSSDEIVKAEMFQIAQLVALGLGRYEAIRAVEKGVDWRAIEPPATGTACPAGSTPELAR
jgi:hypothetical protein